MKCYYELLSVDRDADDDALKKSYRKLALKWHPDKNPDNLDEATSIFREIQAAYEVLSDPQERAWYDKHREVILRGGYGNEDRFKDDAQDLFAYFTATCFKGFTDEDGSFYQVYSEVFATTAKEDEDEDFPQFGTSNSSFDDVNHFYGVWESYSTSRSYVWMDKYDTRDGQDRFQRRAMEAENKKLRQKAKKERNELVRALVAFVRKRDPRVAAYKEWLQAENDRKAFKAEQHRSAILRKRQQEFDAIMRQRDAEAVAKDERALEHLEANLSDEEGAIVRLDDNDILCEENQSSSTLFECPACNKNFRSLNTMKAHVKSKKHKDALVKLCKSLLKDQIDMGDETPSDLDSLIAKFSAQLLPNEEEEDMVEKNDTFITSNRSRKKKKSKGRKVFSDDVDGFDNDLVADASTESPVVTSNGDRPSINPNEFPITISPVDSAGENDHTVAPNGAKNKKKNKDRKVFSEEDIENADNVPLVAAKFESFDVVSEGDTPSRDELPSTVLPIETSCAHCLKAFPSKSKLFLHLKDNPSHALPLNMVNKPSSSLSRPGKSKKNKGKNQKLK